MNVGPTAQDFLRAIDALQAMDEPERPTWRFGELALRACLGSLDPERELPSEIVDVKQLYGYDIIHDPDHPWRAEFS